MKREPLSLIMALVIVVQFVLHVAKVEVLDTDLAEAIATLIVIALGTWAARRKVTPVADPRTNRLGIANRGIFNEMND